MLVFAFSLPTADNGGAIGIAVVGPAAPISGRVAAAAILADIRMLFPFIGKRCYWANAKLTAWFPAYNGIFEYPSVGGAAVQRDRSHWRLTVP